MIVVQSAQVRLSDKIIFQNLNLEILPNRWTCILGGSGVGKSTLLRLIARLIPEVSDVSINIPIKDHIAYMAQTDLLLPWASVLDNVLLGYRLRGQMAKSLIEQAHAILVDMGLLRSEHERRPAQLSGGMRQRVALARTLMENKPIVLMDEPFSALDAVTRHRLQALAAEKLIDRTVLLVTHDPFEALRLGHRILILAGTPAQVVYQLDLPELNTPRDLHHPELVAQHGVLLQQLLLSMEQESQ